MEGIPDKVLIGCSGAAGTSGSRAGIIGRGRSAGVIGSSRAGIIIERQRVSQGGVQGTVEGLGVEAGRAAGNKCLRCWKFDEQVGEDGLCPRCARVLGK